jgi:hypothetical protein
MTTLTEIELLRLIVSCRTIMEETGSEYMWDQYDALIKKLKVMLEEEAGKTLHNGLKP